MQRCNPLGWLSRSHFEERWMQLLGVINQPHPLESINPEGNNFDNFDPETINHIIVMGWYNRLNQDKARKKR